MLFLFHEIIFLFFDLDYQNLAMLGFDNCPISEKENYLLKKKVRIRVFPPLCNLFPATKNIYSTSDLRFSQITKVEKRKRRKNLFLIFLCVFYCPKLILFYKGQGTLCPDQQITFYDSLEEPQIYLIFPDFVCFDIKKVLVR